MVVPASYKGEIPWEEMIRFEGELCGTDRTWLLERHAVIKNAQGQLQLMSPLKRAQRKVLAVIDGERKKKKPVRIIIGKSRKQGQSTLIEADLYAEVVYNQIDALVIAHDRQLSEYVFGICRRYHEYWDRQFRSDIPPVWAPNLYKGVVSKGEMRFQGHEGHILVATAGTTYAGTGMTPSYIHSSEMSKWENGLDVATSLFQSIADKPGTTFVIESTFNGYDGLFLPMWEEAYNHSSLEFKEINGKMEYEFTVKNHHEWNGFIPVFISAMDDEQIWRDFEDDEDRRRFTETMDEYERFLEEKNGATLEFLYGRRHLLKHKCRNDLSILKQEYPVTSQEAVRASGRNRFSLDKLDRQPIEKGELMSLEYSGRWDKKIIGNRDSGSMLTVFRHPVSDHRYVLAIDTAEGKLDEHGKDPDNSVAVVFDCDAGMEQAATYCGRVSPENLVAPCVMLAEWYNSAYTVIESNASGYHLCVEFGKKYPRERLYHRDDYDPEKSRMRREIGHRTHVGNRESILVSGLANAIEENSVVFHDERTVLECKRFVYKTGGGTAAEEGYHDDHVIASALAVLGAKVYPRLARLEENRERIFQAYTKQKNAEKTRCSITGF